jgi:lipid-A-disaccharide synthase-like uncharacterized protein
MYGIMRIIARKHVFFSNFPAAYILIGFIIVFFFKGRHVMKRIAMETDIVKPVLSPITLVYVKWDSKERTVKMQVTI